MRNRILLIASAALTAAACAQTAPFNFRDHLGLQLWSLRKQFADDREAALDLVKGYGIVEVEAAGLYGWTPEDYLEQLEKRGLAVRSAHIGYDALVEDATSVVAEMVALGVDTVFCPWISHEDGYDASENARAIAHFNTWGALFKEADIQFGYHPHGFEFVQGEQEGDTLFDELVRGCDPALVNFEMDVFWVAHAGVDPVELLNKYPDRWLALHIKDIRKGALTGLSTGSAPSTDKVAVGEGQIDWKAVIGRAQELGVRYYFIEDESPDPLTNIPKSLQYLKNLKVD